MVWKYFKKKSERHCNNNPQVFKWINFVVWVHCTGIVSDGNCFYDERFNYKYKWVLLFCNDEIKKNQITKLFLLLVSTRIFYCAFNIHLLCAFSSGCLAYFQSFFGTENMVSWIINILHCMVWGLYYLLGHINILMLWPDNDLASSNWSCLSSKNKGWWFLFILFLLLIEPSLERFCQFSHCYQHLFGSKDRTSFHNLQIQSSICLKKLRPTDCV